MNTDDTRVCICGEVMILYRDVAWECGQALSALEAEGWIDDIGASPPVLDADAPQWARDMHQHLLDTRTPHGEVSDGKR